MWNFIEWLNSKGRNPVAYQITYLRNIDSIANSKLMPRGGDSPWEKPHLQAHSAKGVFFCSTPQCAKHWIQQMKEESNNLSDHPFEEGWIPIILRFKLNRNSWRPDNIANAELGTMQKRTNFYTQKNIDPQGIEVWDGQKWSSDMSDATNIQYHYKDADDYHYGGYPYPDPKQW